MVFLVKIVEGSKFWTDVFYVGSLCFGLQHNKFISHYLIMLIAVQVKNYSTLYSGKQNIIRWELLV